MLAFHSTLPDFITENTLAMPKEDRRIIFHNERMKWKGGEALRMSMRMSLCVQKKCKAGIKGRKTFKVN